MFFERLKYHQGKPNKTHETEAINIEAMGATTYPRKLKNRCVHEQLFFEAGWFYPRKSS